MRRNEHLSRLAGEPSWDVVVVGGGATGLGIAVESSSRGYKTLLLEQADFCKGTSSRSTKLIHGGVRYLAQGNVRLVTDALRERGILLRNAPDWVQPLPIALPLYRWWEGPYYWTGLKLYDLLAGKLGIEKSSYLSDKEMIGRIPNLRTDGLRGGVLFYDAQFDDSRFGLEMAQMASRLGACLLNYGEVVGFIREAGKVAGVVAREQFSGKEFEVRSKGTINATGIFSDGLRRLDDPAGEKMVALSQGSHVVLDASFLPGKTAVLIPKTEDGRVLFAIPWQDRVLAGTTDIPVDEAQLEPVPRRTEIDFILSHLRKILTVEPGTKDVLSTFAGLRPLVRSSGGRATAALSRDHTLVVSASNLVSIVGGKWTTYRKMAEDAVDKLASVVGLATAPSRTRSLQFPAPDREMGEKDASGDGRLHPRLPVYRSDVVKAVKSEWACSVEDVLARRSRALLLDARASMDLAPEVARIMAEQLDRGSEWIEDQVAEFRSLALGYLPEE